MLPAFGSSALEKKAWLISPVRPALKNPDLIFKCLKKTVLLVLSVKNIQHTQKAQIFSVIRKPETILW
jgi:hypothetical protein